jgi:hypothetical protein
MGLMDAVEWPICIYVTNCTAWAWAPVLLGHIWVAVGDADATSKNPDAAKCTDSAMYDVFGNGFRVIY